MQAHALGIQKGDLLTKVLCTVATCAMMLISRNKMWTICQVDEKAPTASYIVNLISEYKNTHPDAKVRVTINSFGSWIILCCPLAQQNA